MGMDQERRKKMTNTTDKYASELERAIHEATICPREKANFLKYHRFVGAVKDGRGSSTYYYYDSGDGKYYSETDFDREMREVIKKQNQRKFARKYT